MASALQKCLLTSVNPTISIVCIKYSRVCQNVFVGFSRLSEGSVVQNSLRTPWVGDFFNTGLSIAERACDISLCSKWSCCLNTLYILLLLVPFSSQNVTD
jgi:hypothetical protein